LEALEDLLDLLNRPIDPLLHYCATRAGRLDVENWLIKVVRPLATLVGQANSFPVVYALVEQGDIDARRRDGVPPAVHLMLDQSSGSYQTSRGAI
jgi:hypothetical protein